MKNKYGYEVGDYALIVVDTHHCFKRGDVIKLRADDGSYYPYWDKVVEGVTAKFYEDTDRVVGYGHLKPCNKYGWSVGDKGVVIQPNLTANLGDIITLAIDDNSTNPFWTGATKGFAKAALNYSKVRKLTDSEQTDYEEKLAERAVKPKLAKPVSTAPVTGYKFKVSSPKQSKRLQKVLFKLGYTWGYNSSEVLTIDHTELYANNQAKRLTQSSNRSYFDAHEYQEVDINWLVKLK